MIFETAMREHAEFKIQLVMHLNDSGRLDERRISKPTSCSLGTWLRQCAAQYSHLKEFEDVVAVHKKFHTKAGEILALIKDGKRYEAKEALKPEGSFSDLTTELSQKMLLLKRRCVKLA